MMEIKYLHPVPGIWEEGRHTHMSVVLKLVFSDCSVIACSGACLFAPVAPGGRGLCPFHLLSCFLAQCLALRRPH